MIPDSVFLVKSLIADAIPAAAPEHDAIIDPLRGIPTSVQRSIALFSKGFKPELEVERKCRKSSTHVERRVETSDI